MPATSIPPADPAVGLARRTIAVVAAEERSRNPREARALPPVGKWLLIATLLAILVASAVALYVGWTMGEDVQMSGHAYVALALGVVFSLLVGCGLMALVFFSSRRGYDDAVKRFGDPE